MEYLFFSDAMCCCPSILIQLASLLLNPSPRSNHRNSMLLLQKVNEILSSLSVALFFKPKIAAAACPFHSSCWTVSFSCTTFLSSYILLSKT
ncbi:hypothetical protein VIGAN_08276600 [Vigna angularis var. angularis]|uniref:Uncharacterized protein n=1 Tax=Vigna angularis var. angularis TaxID=157739 RepID=A0A0S3ST34_PHAAN|nr:hypothetical protein VIGAN_08276600 [Vigna angularis var. angularis]